MDCSMAAKIMDLSSKEKSPKDEMLRNSEFAQAKGQRMELCVCCHL